MKAVVVLILALAASQANGRRLLQDCSNAEAILASVPELKDIATVVGDFSLLPGVPSDATLFMPTNTGVAELMKTVVTLLPGATVDTLFAKLQGSPLLDTVTKKLTSVVLYHAVPNTASLTADELAAEGSLQTALGAVQGKDFLVTFAGGPGNWTVTDAAGNVASVVGKPLSVCGSTVYLVDRVLMPTSNLLTTPDTTKEQVLALLGGAGASPAPAR